MKLFLIVLSGLFFTYRLSVPVQPPKAAGTIRVEVTGLHNDKGKVLLSLYNAGEGFPSKANKAFRNKSGSIKNETCTVTFADVAPGKYAISLLHDENSNNEVDKNGIGIPKEGIGFSNNVEVTFGPPGFDEASFTVKEDETEVKIKIKYF